MGPVRRAERKLRSFLGRQSFALNELDKKLDPYIKIRNGFFVEAGANDGLSQSNTLYFEKYKGWRGLLIEAIPDLAEKCRKNRPRCIVDSCALVSTDCPTEAVEMRYCNLMSLVKGGLNSERDEQTHIQSGIQFLAENEQPYVVSVPARTLSQVLDSHQIERVDLLSLDVEGYETQVLKGLDWDRHCPEFMLIEVRRREDVESVIGNRYKPIAVLNDNGSYCDVLYKRR